MTSAAPPPVPPVARACAPFPFRITDGRIPAPSADDGLRGRIVQVLFTDPGERLDLPDFGCGLFAVVFEPQDDLLRAALNFRIARSLTTWLGDEITVDAVDVSVDEEVVRVEVAYTTLDDRHRAGLRVQFPTMPAWTRG